MAVNLLAQEVSDLCLGKPALRFLSVSASIAEALVALKQSEGNFISVWTCEHPPAKNPGVGGEDFQCVGKVCMVDIICYLCKEENLLSPSAALKAPVSVLLPKIPGLVMHVEPNSSLLEAIDLILQGAQNLVVPIQTRTYPYSRRKQQNQQKQNGNRQFCWLTQEDIIRHFLGAIGLFSPIATLPVSDLGIITTDIHSVNYHFPASTAIGAISSSLADQTSVAVVDDDGILIGEISPSTLACCDETVAAAIATLSSGDLMAYIDGGGPPDDLVQMVRERLKERNLEGMYEEFGTWYSSSSDGSFSSSSSDEESSLPSPTGTLATAARSRRYSRSMSYSARMVRRAEAMVCHPGSSLVAVMIQAIAHRVNYVWVIEDDDDSLVGIVTFCEMLKVIREHLLSSLDTEFF